MQKVLYEKDEEQAGDPRGQRSRMSEIMKLGNSDQQFALDQFQMLTMKERQVLVEQRVRRRVLFEFAKKMKRARIRQPFNRMDLNEELGQFYYGDIFAADDGKNEDKL